MEFASARQPTACFNDRRISEAFFAALSERASDLLDIAATVYASDRLNRRRRGFRLRDPHDQGWKRSLSLDLPVRDLKFWTSGSAGDALGELLYFLTDDEWQFAFRSHVGPRRPSEVRPHLFAYPLLGDGAVALFSGGLDAYAGVALFLDQYPDRQLALVASGTNFRQIAHQARLLRAIKQRCPSVVPIIVPVRVGGASTFQQEPSQRSRGFLFLATGAAAAEAASVQEILLFENGIGAINLPYIEGQSGAHTSRGAHPKTLRLAGELFSLVLDRQIRVANPLLSKTKAEACRGLSPDWREHIPETVSCDTGFTNRRPGPQLCGICTSCLLRRQALHAAGLSFLDRPDEYRADVVLGQLHPNESLQLRAMRGQVGRMRDALASPEPWAALIAAFPALDRVRNELVRDDAIEVVHERLLRLFRSYVAEWDTFLPPAAIDERELSQVLHSEAAEGGR